jgi:transcriptional regulator with PAS, ATPase and Fis domain
MASDEVGDGTLATEHIGGGIGDAGRHLLVIGRTAVAIHPLPERAEIVVGRSRGVDLVIDDRSVSRRHARLVVEPDRVTVADLGSANGTRIGHQPVGEEPAAITPGEPFHLGAVTLVIEGGLRPSAAAAAPAAVGSGMDQLYALAGRLAGGTVSVLIQGETGVGKELMAERIHELSPRAAGPFVRLNCAAIAESLLESELFGHERGAFTGAHNAKPGLIELAAGGTLFFDEVGELPLGLQAKILRAVEDRAVRRVGGVEARPVDVRYVSATNRDLEDEVEASRFRRDLYYRLAGATLHIPPLRERRNEIPDLAARFVADAGRTLGRSDLRLDADAIAWVGSQEWLGNVRELRSACERAVLLCDDGPLQRAHFMTAAAGRRRPTTVPPAGEPIGRAPTDPGESESLRDSARREVETVERRRILEALEQAGGNQTRAAELLGISRRTLINRLDAYDLPRPRKPNK